MSFRTEFSPTTNLPKIRVLLADDHALVREGLRLLLSIERGIEVVGEASNGREAVMQAKAPQPAVVVIDLSMPILNGFEATRQIRRELPSTAVIVLSAHEDDDYVDRAIDAGAAGYVLKHDSSGVLAHAIREVAKGRLSFTPHTVRRLLLRREKALLDDPDGRVGPRQLTSREVEVLQLIAEGRANKQTAAELGISVKTVEKHRHALKAKLDIHDTAGLTRYALAVGIIEGGVRFAVE
jgi:two-component system, NarL family, nitrate/nitrite response regulator NarL